MRRAPWLVVALLVALGGAPAIALPVTTEGTLEGVGGISLATRAWAPSGASRGVVVLVHGLKDHSARYQELAERLVADGYTVRAFDLRGHARSGGDRVAIDRFTEYDADLARVMAEARKAAAGEPVFLFGHSLGGAIALRYALDHPDALRGLILSAPAFRSTASSLLATAIPAISAVTPGLPVFALDNADFSRDPQVVAAMERDPLIYQGAAPARTAGELLQRMADNREAAPTLRVPVLVMHGTADRVTSPQGSEELCQAATKAERTLKLYPGLYHDLLHEPEHATVLADVTAWIERHTPQRSMESP